jgi:hypothetical protein
MPAFFLKTFFLDSAAKPEMLRPRKWPTPCASNTRHIGFHSLLFIRLMLSFIPPLDIYLSFDSPLYFAEGTHSAHCEILRGSRCPPNGKIEISLDTHQTGQFAPLYKDKGLRFFYILCKSILRQMDQTPKSQLRRLSGITGGSASEVSGTLCDHIASYI